MKDAIHTPQIFSDIVKGQTGWIFLSSPDKANLKNLISEYYTNNLDKNVHIVGHNTWKIQGANQVSIPLTDPYLFQKDFEHATFIFDDVEDSRLIHASLRLAEKGHLVLFLSTVPKMTTWFHVLSMYFSEGEKKSFIRRLQDCAKLFLGLYSVQGINGKEFAFEMLLTSPELRVALEEVDKGGIENILNSSVQQVGVHSLNQSLVQLLVKRKIDIKNAFQISHNPSELDLLLKKLGV